MTAAVEQRPRYHVRPAAGWVNDPNAPVRVGDTYHLFCQHQPSSAVHADIHWAHFTSTDLVTWRAHEPALTPDPGGPDQDGCWSGSAVLVDGAPVLVYSGYRRPDDLVQAVCLAWPGAGGWVKDAANPVLAGPPPGLDVAMFRDPCVWPLPGGGFEALLGSGLPGPGGGTVGAALLYRTPDLRRWDYVGPFCVAQGPAFAEHRTGLGWECPQLVRGDGGLAALIVSGWRPDQLGPVWYAGGRREGDRLVPAVVGRLDHGPDFYAPVVMADREGPRHVLWGWAWEARPPAADAAAGGAGVLTLPRQVSVGDDGRPRQVPAPELAALRGAPATWDGLRLAPGRVELLDQGAGDTFELAASLRPGPRGRAWLRLRCSPDAAEHTELGVDAAAGQVYLSRDRASLDREVAGGRFSVDLGPGQAERGVPVRAYVDRSIVEVFVGDGDATLTARIYPTRTDSTGLVAGVDGAPGAASVTTWPVGVRAVLAP